jgi:outer membrane protein assembly factor BamE (lipoprotein component of BamABCDE complex)
MPCPPARPLLLHRCLGLPFLAGTLALLAGCVTDVPLGEPGVREQEVLDQAAQLRVAVATREQVRAALGAPLLADAGGRAEVFRVSGKQHQMALFFVPYPVPMPLPGEKQEGYTLVAYDEAGVLAAVDAGLATAAVFGRTRSLVLRAGDYQFVHSQADRLLVTAERYLRDETGTTDATDCTVLVGCEQTCDDTGVGGLADESCGVCWTYLQVDHGPVQQLPLLDWVMWPLGESDTETRAGRELTCGEVGGSVLQDHCSILQHQLVPLRLAPGVHTLRVTSRPLDGEAAGEFSCVAGEVVFATLTGQVTERYSLSAQLRKRLKVGAATGAIAFDREPPPALRGQRVVVTW